MNIIADVAGRYKELLALIDQMPKEPFLCVGDLNDRGPDSKKVIEFVMKNGDSLLGNHEFIMLDWCAGCPMYPDPNYWVNKVGGGATLISYGIEKLIDRPEGCTHQELSSVIPEEHLKWIAKRPLFYFTEGLLVTHASYPADWSLDLLDKPEFFTNEVIARENSLIWNREKPAKREGIFQIFGHNAYWDYAKEGDGWLCIDNSNEKKLTGINWPTKKLYHQKYFEVKDDPRTEGARLTN